MIIAKIKTFASTINLHGANYVTNILLSGSDSVSDKNIVSYSWYTQILSGVGTMSPNTFLSGSSGEISESLSINFDFDTILRIKVVLTVTDEEGKVSRQSSVIESNLTPLNPILTFHTIDANPTILPEGNLEFRYTLREVDLLTNSLFPVNQTTYSNYHIDYVVENLVTIDETTSNRNHVFKRKYQEECDYNTTRLFASGPNRSVDDNFIQVQFNPIIKNAKDLIIQSVNECKELYVYSQTQDYIDKFTGRVNNENMRYLRFHANVNCCENGGLNYLLAPRYKFDFTYTNCQDSGQSYIEPISGNIYPVYLFDVTITGINLLYVKSFTHTNERMGTTVNTYTNTLTIPAVPYAVDPANLLPHISTSGKIVLTTIDDFEYTIEYDVAYTAIAGCFAMPYVTNIIYPNLPEGMTVTELTTHTQIELNSIFYMQSSVNNPFVPLPDGIYVIELNDSNISNETVSHCIFVNCQTYCLVVKALINECDIKIKILYDALVYADLCEQVTCENKCYLYEILRDLLADCDCLIYELEHQLPDLDTGCGCSKL